MFLAPLEDLKTVKKVDENRKEVNYVVISDEIINKYVLTVNNNVNNHNYEDILTDNNINENVNNNLKYGNDSISASEMFDKLSTLNKEYNDRLERVNEELMSYKSKSLLLEDKAGREGFYINEINTLKKDNNLLLKGLITLLIMFIITFVSLVSIVLYHKAIEGNKEVSTTVENVSNPVQAQKKEVKPVKAQPPIRKK